MIQHKGTQTISTKRLILRKFTLDDANAMYRNWASDPEVTKYLMWPTHRDINDTKAILKYWIDGYDDQKNYQWAIEYDGEPIGSISVVSRDDRVGKAEIGYCIGKRWWHQGITSEALAGVIGYLFDEVGFQRIESRHDVNNPNSGRVMKKCGMKYEGTTRKSDWNNSGICNTCHYAILKNDPR